MSNLAVAAIEGGVGFLFGLYLTLNGYGVLGRSFADDPVLGPRKAKAREMHRWVGPLLMIFGIFTFLRSAYG